MKKFIKNRLNKIKSLYYCVYLEEHDFKYNFPVLANKRICAICKKKETFNLRELDWEDIPFEDDRDDDTLIKKWIR